MLRADSPWAWLAGAALALSGCSQGYDAAMESAGATVESAADAQATAAAPLEAVDAGAAAAPPKRPDVNSSGPVGKAILAPTDALD